MQTKNQFLSYYHKNLQNLNWNFFEFGYGKGATYGIGGSIKRQIGHFVDIVHASVFFEAVKDRSKIKLFLVSKNDIAQVLMGISSGIIALNGTMQVHQLLAQQIIVLSYRIIFKNKFF